LVGYSSNGYHELNSNGIFERANNSIIGNNYRGDINVTDLFFQVPLSSIYEFKIISRESDINLHYNLNDFLDSFEKRGAVNNITYKTLKRIRDIQKTSSDYSGDWTINNLEFYKIMQSLLDSKGSPVTEVYLVDRDESRYSNEKTKYLTYKNYHAPMIVEAEKRKEIEDKRKEEEKKKIQEEQRLREIEEAELAEKIKKAKLEITNADINFILNNYLQFSGGIELLNRINSSSYKKEWKSNISGYEYIQKVFYRPSYAYYTETSYQGNVQVIISDLKKLKGEYRLNGKKQQKLDKDYIRSLIQSAILFPELNKSQFNYLGTEELTTIKGVKEMNYKVSFGGKTIYYSTLDFRKTREIEGQTRIDYLDYYERNGCMISTKMIITTDGDFYTYTLEDFNYGIPTPNEARF
ncbi:hypothetical protein OAC17_01300, partial [Flavobacteriaceae bacterium]|nr:hypothetical protein [Flavobacteriaceae bacterium]